MMVHNYKARTYKVEAGGSGIQNQPHYIECGATQGYKRHCLKNTKRNKKLTQIVLSTPNELNITAYPSLP